MKKCLQILGLVAALGLVPLFGATPSFAAGAVEATPAPTESPRQVTVDVQDVRRNRYYVGDFACTDTSCDGTRTDLATGESLPLSIAACDVGDDCLYTDAKLEDGGLLTILRSTATTADSRSGSTAISQQEELRLEAGDGTSTNLYLLTFEDPETGATTGSYSVNGEKVDYDVFVALAQDLAGAYPEVQVVNKFTAAIGRQELGIEIGNGTGFLGCIKECVEDCGGTHNDGNCSTFSWSDGGDGGVATCATICAAGCGVQHPFGLIACWAAVLF